ncbi:MAG: Gldg family protein [Candidatus Ornithomonoglobus sp.]
MNLKQTARKWFGSKDFRLGGYSAAAGIMAAAIGIAVVIMADTLPSKYTQLDISGKNLYSISKETENIVKGLDNEVNIYLIAQESKKDSIIDRMLQKYAGLSGNIKYSVQDPVKNPSFAKKYTNSEVTQNSVIVVSGDKSRYISYNDIYKTDFDYESYSQTTEFDGENCVTSAISYVSSDDIPKLYTLSGHGEAQLDSSFEDMVSDRSMETDEISLITESEVPSDADFVLINEPQSDLSEQEVALLKAYADKGGNLIIVSGYTGKDMPNLNSLTEYYGCALDKEMVMEGDPSKCIQGYNYYLIPSIGSHEITDPLRDEKYFVLVPMAVNIKKAENGRGNITEILTTSDKAYVKADTASMDTIEKTDLDTEGSCTVGIVSTIGEGDSESKLVLISAGQFLTQQSNQLVAGGNGDLFLNTLSWMSGREDGISIHAKPLGSERLTVSDSVSGILGFITVFLIPAAVVAGGIYVIIRRKKR